jgi:hypothetical protein
MKKFTIQQFADNIRKNYPKKYDDLSDNDLVFKWLKVYYLDAEKIEPSELLKLGIGVAKGTTDKVKNYVNDKIDSVKDSDEYKDLTGSFGNLIKNANGTATTDSTQTNTQKPTQDSQQGSTQTKLYQNVYNLKSDNTPTPQALNTKTCNDFPFTIGCINPKIGQLNKIFVGDELSDIFDNHLYKVLLSDGYFDMPGEKRGEISQTLYNSAIKNSKEQNESINKKKVIKETVKKVLKERILKK